MWPKACRNHRSWFKIRSRVSSIAVLLLFLASFESIAAACEYDRVDIRGSWGTARFYVEVADTPSQRNRGLMFRESLAPTKGMLFLYDEPTTATFWMKNTLVPLDILFFDEHGVLQSVHEEAEPLSTESIHGGDDILAVLEINGGLVRRFNIGEGSTIRHPGIARENAKWPCESD